MITNDCVNERINSYIKDITGALNNLYLEHDVYKVIYRLMAAYESGKKVITFGNGGSGCLASHLVQDLAKHTIISNDKTTAVTAKRFRAMCLNESIATMTTWANDVDYSKVFSEQLINWCESGDVVIGITGSGNTKNVIEALEVAKKMGATAIAFTGGTGGRTKEVAEISLIVKTNNFYAVEDVLQCVVHIITDILRDRIQGRL